MTDTANETNSAATQLLEDSNPFQQGQTAPADSVVKNPAVAVEHSDGSKTADLIGELDKEREQLQAVPASAASGAVVHDFDGTTPADIAKMTITRPVGNLPLGPGQVTGGHGMGGRANVAPDQPSGANLPRQ